MTIRVSEEREQLILSLMRAGRFPSADAVIDEALRLFGQGFEFSGSDDAPGPVAEGADDERAENLRRLGLAMDALPVAADTDGLSNRDHDRILNGR